MPASRRRHFDDPYHAACHAEACGSFRALVCAASNGCDCRQRIGAAPIAGGLGGCAALRRAVDLGFRAGAAPGLYLAVQIAASGAERRTELRLPIYRGISV